MPLNFTTIPDRHDRSGAKTRKLVQITGPSSYATGGESIPASAFGLNRVEVLLIELAVNAAGTVRGLQYDASTGLLRWIVLDTGAEVANGTDLSGFSARAEAIGV